MKCEEHCQWKVRVHACKANFRSTCVYVQCTYTVVIIAAGSANGVIIICTIFALIIIAVVVLVHLKWKKKALHYTSNIAYASHDIDGQCTEVENYSISQPQAIINFIKHCTECCIHYQTRWNSTVIKRCLWVSCAPKYWQSWWVWLYYLKESKPPSAHIIFMYMYSNIIIITVSAIIF